MADKLAAPEDVASLLEQDLDAFKTIMLVEAATAVVQEAADRPPQRIVEVVDDPVTLLGVPGSWFELPQRPVQSIASLSLDGEELTEGTDFKRYGHRLWRCGGWQTKPLEPSTVDTIYTHGYPDGDQRLQLGRGAILSLVRGVYGNPEGAIQVRIDDYAASYAKFSAALEATEYLQQALRRQYGRPAGMVRLG